nr:BTAD domain-containing putative transcriptional regulator [Anaerolineae bacterium]
AVQLYTGDLLAGLYEDWCLEAREQLRKLYFRGLNKLTAYHEARGAYERAVDYAEKILTYDKVQERVHQRLMRLHWRMGNRDAAVAQYRTCVQLLHDELGVGPMARTQQLYHQLVAQRPPPPARNGRLLTPSPPTVPQPAADVPQAGQHLQRLKKLISEAYRELNALEASLAQHLANYEQRFNAADEGQF